VIDRVSHHRAYLARRVVKVYSRYLKSGYIAAMNNRRYRSSNEVINALRPHRKWNAQNAATRQRGGVSYTKNNQKCSVGNNNHECGYLARQRVAASPVTTRPANIIAWTTTERKIIYFRETRVGCSLNAARDVRRRTTHTTSNTCSSSTY